MEPSLDFTPFLYTPLCFYAGAAVSKLTGAGFFPLRLVSLLSSVGCLAVLFAFVRGETGSAVPGLVSAGLFAAAFKICGSRFDIARVDSLFVFLLLAGLYVLRNAGSARALALAGTLFALPSSARYAVSTAMSSSLAMVVWPSWRGEESTPISWRRRTCCGARTLC